MDQYSLDFLRKHALSATFLFAVILGSILYKFTGIGAKLSIIIAMLVGVSDYVAVKWLLDKVERDAHE